MYSARAGGGNRPRGLHVGVDALSRVPGLGPELAARIHDQCGVETLEELEQAIADGRLTKVAGMGARRIEGYLAGVLGRGRPRPSAVEEPTVAELLDVDGEYREKAEKERLPLKGRRVVRGREVECFEFCRVPLSKAS